VCTSWALSCLLCICAATVALWPVVQWLVRSSGCSVWRKFQHRRSAVPVPVRSPRKLHCTQRNQKTQKVSPGDAPPAPLASLVGARAGGGVAVAEGGVAVAEGGVAGRRGELAACSSQLGNWHRSRSYKTHALESDHRERPHSGPELRFGPF
jgi:hypothetical protein